MLAKRVVLVLPDKDQQLLMTNQDNWHNELNRLDIDSIDAIKIIKNHLRLNRQKKILKSERILLAG